MPPPKPEARARFEPLRTRIADNRTWLVALVLLAVSAWLVRIADVAFTTTPDGVYFHDSDTVRRLARLQHPGVGLDPREGWPEGTTIHWTRPMDWVIEALDAIAPSIAPTARIHESGAAWSGPVLGTLAVIVFAVLAGLWIGRWLGLVVALAYSLCLPVVMSSQLGNGDHQNLQQLLLVIAVVGWFAAFAARPRPRLAAVAGAALGAALWVSAESMATLVFLSCGSALFLALSSRERRQAAMPSAWAHAIACCAVTIAGASIANSGDLLVFTWDRISGFQILMTAAPVAFVGAVRALESRLRDPRLVVPAAMAAVLAVFLLPFLVVPPLHAALAAQSQSLGAASAWTKVCVRESQGLLTLPFTGTFSMTFGIYTFSVLLYAAPILLLGVLVHRGIELPLRAAFALVSVGLAVLTLFELKVAQMFAIVFVFWIVLGTAGFVSRIEGQAHGPLGRRAAYAAGALTVLLWFGNVPSWRYTATNNLDLAQQARLELVRFLARQRAALPKDETRIGVLGPWEVGAHVMYYSDLPVVASGYHRNLAGIHDSMAFMVGRIGPATDAIVDRRLVRWVVRYGDPAQLLQAGQVFPDLPQLATLTDRSFSLAPAARFTCWARLEVPNPPGRYRQVFETQTKATWFGSYGGPVFRVFEVASR